MVQNFGEEKILVIGFRALTKMLKFLPIMLLSSAQNYFKYML